MQYIIDNSLPLMLVCFAFIIFLAFRSMIDCRKHPCKELALYYAVLGAVFAVACIALGCIVKYQLGHNPSAEFMENYEYWTNLFKPITEAVYGRD